MSDILDTRIPTYFNSAILSILKMLLQFGEYPSIGWCIMNMQINLHSSIASAFSKGLENLSLCLFCWHMVAWVGVGGGLRHSLGYKVYLLRMLPPFDVHLVMHMCLAWLIWSKSPFKYYVSRLEGAGHSKFPFILLGQGGVGQG